jgi:preprotein translocase SecF subunit
MKFKHLRLVPDDTRIPFMHYRMWSFALSALLIVLSIAVWGVRGFNFGIDFTGGTVIEVQQKAGALDVGHIRELIDKLNVGEAQVQDFKGTNNVQIRLPQQSGGEEAQQTALKKVEDALGANFEFRNKEVVGPAVSSDLRDAAFIAVVMSMALILVYLWFRFEWQYAVGAILTTLHDVVLTIGYMVILQVPFDLPILAAILTLVGYSLNDTIVIYDRIREVMRKYKKLPLEQVIDLSINQTLGRTVVTSVTVLIAALALLIFGGEAMRGFNEIMVLGVVVGTYSSIVISAPLLIYLKLPAGEAREAALAKAAAAASDRAAAKVAAKSTTAAPKTKA